MAVPLCLAAADDLPSAARELGRRTAATVGAAPIAATWRNLTATGVEEVAKARAAFESAGVKISDAAEVHATLTVSENASSGFLVEELWNRDDRQVWISTWKRTPPPRSTGGVSIEKRLIWQQDEPILDVASTGPDSLVVLTPFALIRTAPRQEIPIATARPWPRDMRGRLEISGNAVTVKLPGVNCAGAWTPELTLNCGPADAPWSLAAGRNYFDGRVGARKAAPPFYTAAQANSLWFLALTDGATGIFDAAFERVGTVHGWGSDIAAAPVRCGGAPVVLATRPGEGRDSVQAFSIVDRTAAPIGEPAEFAGPITALWPGIAVVHNGKYQAYALSVVCAP